EVRRFRERDDVQAMVTCQLAYEGLDVPRATHLIVLTHIRSSPRIEQAFGRIWRFNPGKRCGWALVPDDERMNRVIEQISREQPSELSDYTGPNPSGESGDNGVPLLLAINGSIDAVHQRFLDQEHEVDELRDRVVEFAVSLGLSGDEPEVLALLRRAKAPPVVSGSEMTVKEREKHLRNQIAAACRSRDAAI